VEAIEKTKRKHDRAYLARVRALPCLFAGRDCVGLVQAHHRTGAGLALKDDDTETMPLCVFHHQASERNFGPCADWDKSLKHAWQDAMVAFTKRRLMTKGVF
jgi:hypothetical protein